MEYVMGKKLTSEQIFRRNQRAITKAMRELEREKFSMHLEEKKLINGIKKLAREGHKEALNIMAKDLVLVRKYIRKFVAMKLHLQTVSLTLSTLKSQNAITQAMRDVVKGMHLTLIQFNLPQIQRIVYEFQQEIDMVDIKEEFGDQIMDDALDDIGDEIESDAVISEVLEQLGLQTVNKLSNLKEVSNSFAIIETKPPEFEMPVAGGSGCPNVDDLEARLNKLREQ